MPLHLTLVIPAYNEAERIGESLRRTLSYLGSQDYASEVIVVSDGSTDGTPRIVQECMGGPGPELHLVDLPENRGKGHAVRVGMQQGQGVYRVFSDADASTPIEELEQFWPLFDDGAGVVIGSRALPESDVQVHQAWCREGMGRTFNLLLRLLGLTRFHDTQCGFKGFTAQACEIIFPRQSIERFSFDVELLYIAQRHGLRIEEVPVRWINSSQSRLNPVTDSARMFLDLLRIRRNRALGRYD